MHEARGFIRELCRELGVQAGESAIDVACGRGRHAQVLSEAGLQTLGIDLSEESIAYAQEFAHEGLEFKVADMLRPLPGAPVHWVFNLFTSFGYFEDDADHELAIQNMANALEPGGKLILDYMNSIRISANLVPSDTVVTDMAQYNISRRVENGTIIKTITFTEECQLNHFEERVRAFSESDLRGFMEKAGLEVEGVKGDYDLSDYDPEYSDRLLIIAKKPA
jgi:SAM-dependent methyltransferase